MLTKQSSGSANGLVSWYGTPCHGERGDINAARAGETDPPLRDPLPAGIAACTEAVGRKRPFWSSVIGFVVEGLASFGASPYPMVFFMEQPALFDVERGTGRRVPAGNAVAFAHDKSWEREREIARAVAALEKCDDRTLRALGIRHRSDIEQTVRYCHDC